MTAVATVPLVFEYEAVCRREEHRAAAGLDRDGVEAFLVDLVSVLEPTPVWFLWRPQLRDAGDEMVLEAAVNGAAEAIVTFNRRDFLPAAERFGVEILKPADVLRRIA